MAAPMSPYSSPAQVAYLLRSLYLGGPPTAITVPENVIVQNHIFWSDAVLEAAFRMVGYKIPFESLSSETWPASQTAMMSYASSVGAAAMVGGYILRPAPAIGPGRSTPGASGNAYADMFERFRQDISSGGLGFRAAYQLGSKAEKFLSDPYGPRLDFLEDYFDPTAYQTMREYTDTVLSQNALVKSFGIDWDYLWELRSTDAD